ncbi:Peroxisomal multifunctional enzyme type 2 [Eumeta japonica]|uniref:Peroxisomal multifunctional enzyme type 2 n=1 Tax=Eumeta variegata TaxID=151549 RepID=A0A4C1U9V6_EUMVA|nr:Peroxisomal multifunctional enzyme type 2 [Eumeta japonica]
MTNGTLLHTLRHPRSGANHSEPSDKNELVAKIRTQLASVKPETARALGGVFLFNIIKEQSVYSWTLDLNKVMVYEGEPDDDPDTTFTLNEHTFKQLVLGREAARTVLQAGRCSVTGGHHEGHET